MTIIVLKNGDIYQGVNSSVIQRNADGLESITITVAKPYIKKQYKNKKHFISTIKKGILDVEVLRYESHDATYSEVKKNTKMTFYMKNIKEIIKG